MTYPSRKEIELALLEVIQKAGGEVDIRDRRVYGLVARYFPQLTDEELARRNRSSRIVWDNRVRWVRLDLVNKGELLGWRAVERPGIWKITDKGISRLESQRYTVGPHDSARLVIRESSKATDIAEARAEESVHLQLQSQIEEIGTILGKYARREYPQDMYRYDVVWKDSESLPRATHCFEVHHKGNLVEALAKLKHALDIWGAKLMIVITDERDRNKAQQLLAPYLTGVFHEIGPLTTVLTPSDINEIHQVFSRHQAAIRVFVGR